MVRIVAHADPFRDARGGCGGGQAGQPGGGYLLIIRAAGGRAPPSGRELDLDPALSGHATKRHGFAGRFHAHGSAAPRAAAALPEDLEYPAP
jgi:hypothetical protein